jgi:hypothetical protein
MKQLINTCVLVVVLLFVSSSVVVAGTWQTGACVRLAPNINDVRLQANPQIAFDGVSTFLVVWQLGDNIASWEKGDIFATRLSIDGSALDVNPIPVCTLANSHQEQPSVIFNGTQFLVVWNDLRNGTDWDIYGCRILSNGTVLDEGGFVIAGGASSQIIPRLAADSAGFIMAYQEKNPSGFYHVCLTGISSVGVVTRFYDPVMPTGDTLKNGIADIVNVANDAWHIAWLEQIAYAPGKSPLNTALMTRRSTGWQLTNIKRADMGMDYRGNYFAAGAQSSIICDGNIATLLNRQDASITSATICLFGCTALVQAGKVSAAFGQGYFAAAGVVGTAQKALCVASPLTEQGLKKDGDTASILYVSKGVITRPVIAGNDTGFVVVFQETIDTTNYLKTLFFHYNEDVSSIKNTDVATSHPSLEINPNPSSSLSRISIREYCVQSLQLFDIGGRKVADFSKLLRSKSFGDVTEILWKTPDVSGTYWAVLKTSRGTTIKPLVIVK